MAFRRPVGGLLNEDRSTGTAGLILRRKVADGVVALKPPAKAGGFLGGLSGGFYGAYGA